MKSLALFLVLSCVAARLWAQTPPQTPPPPPPPHDHMMMGMHQHMQQMQDQVTQMRATLDKMKANLAKITDPALKQQAQFDVDLWESMVQHMESMSKMMDTHHHMDMGDGMKKHPSMPGDTAPPPPEKK